MTDDEILDLWSPRLDSELQRPILGKAKIIAFARAIEVALAAPVAPPDAPTEICTQTSDAVETLLWQLVEAGHVLPIHGGGWRLTASAVREREKAAAQETRAPLVPAGQTNTWTPLGTEVDLPAQQCDLLSWAVSRWKAEVQHRPLVNIHRRSLDDTWRQVIRFAGGDPADFIGPAHDDLLAAAPALVPTKEE